MNSEKIELGVAPIQGYHHHAYILSIVASHPNFNDWFYSHYVGLYCHADLAESNVPLNFWVGDEIVKDKDSGKYTCALNSYFQSVPLVGIERISRDLIADRVDIIDFCMNAVGNGRAIFLYVDKYFIPGSPFYMKRRHSHQILVYGFDKTQRLFNAVGYDDKGQYTHSTISFDNFETGYKEAKSNGHRTYLYFLKQNLSAEYSLRPDKIVEETQRYLDAAPPATVHADGAKLIHGIEVFDSVAHNLAAKESGRVDLRPVHTLWEHKRCFHERIKYINKHLNLGEEQLEAEYKMVVDQVGAARVLVMKYNVTKNKNDLNAAVTHLNQTKRLEAGILSRFAIALSPAMDKLCTATN